MRERLAGEMMSAAETMEFERAARLRDRIAALSAIQGSQGINPKSVEEADVFAVVEEAGQFAVEVFFFRTYQNWGNRTYYPRADRSLSAGEVLDSFLAQFYLDKPPPRLILLSHEIENRAILAEGSDRAGPPGGRDRGAAARREARARRPCGPERAGGARPQAGRNRQPGEAARRPRRGLRHRARHSAGRGLRQFAHHGDECGRGA